VTDVVGFMAAEALHESEFEWIEPEFGCAVVALNMDVRGLEPVGHVEEESETAFA